MKKYLFRFLGFALMLLLTLTAAQEAAAYETMPSLDGFMRDSQRKIFVESMLSYHLQENIAVRDTLENGHSALFFFEGCSDNVEDAKYRDQAYYRIAAVCIAVKLDENREPVIVYFNDNCSTIPDRPRAIGAWELEDVGQVGPATICDGTYELYSVYHSGSYEALQLRTSKQNETVPAVYMTENGFVSGQATYINIHTRTGNHALEKSMWSAGCLLVGCGDFQEYTDLIAKTYYSHYAMFRKGLRVGTVTINRQPLRDELNELYGDEELVDAILISSQWEDPAIYLERCREITEFPEPILVQALQEADAMSLPCRNAADSRSVNVIRLSAEETVEVASSVLNSEGEQWYEVRLLNGISYICAEEVRQVEKKPMTEPEARPKRWYDYISDFFLGK